MYEIATICDVVVPKLSNFKTTILIVYSNLKAPYPLAITVCSDFITDMEEFKPDYLCNSEEEYQKAISEILKSEKVLNKISLLYSKVSII